MSTQKQKFDLFHRLGELGFTYEESAQLRRIEMTLHRWAEGECGDSNGYSSWCITRDDETGKPYREIHPHSGKSYRIPIADREAGALKRAKAIVDARNERLGGAAGKSWGNYLVVYHQGDPRGCALYLVKREDVRKGETIDAVYTRGLAVAA